MIAPVNIIEGTQEQVWHNCSHLNQTSLVFYSIAVFRDSLSLVLFRKKWEKKIAHRWGVSKFLRIWLLTSVFTGNYLEFLQHTLIWCSSVLHCVPRDIKCQNQGLLQYILSMYFPFCNPNLLRKMFLLPG